MSNCFRIYNNNFADTNLLSNFDYTSQQSSFQASNVLNFQRRTLAWRSAGYWVIDATNNNLIFRETIGVNLTAILNRATYTSADDMASELQRALNSAGASTYTVTHDTNLRFKFVSNGVGGGGIFEIYLSGSTVASYIGLTGDLTGALTYHAQNIKVTTGERLTFDLGISTNPKAFMMFFERNKACPLRPGATVKLQANITDAWNSPIVDITMTHDDEVYSYLTTSGIHTTGLRFWSVSFEDTQSPLGYVSVGTIYLGDYMEWDRGAAQFPLQRNYKTASTTMYSEGGQSFVDVKGRTSEYSIFLRALKKEDIELMDNFFYGTDNRKGVGVGRSFPVSMDSGAVYSSNYNRRLILCRFANEPQWRLTSADFFEMSFVLREEL
jgi:hypothetical protein